MSFSVALRDVRPPANAVLWQTADLEEAPPGSPAGPWSVIESFELADYPTPAEPPSFDFLSNEAEFADGLYRVHFIDGEGAEHYTKPAVYTTPDAREVLEAVEDLMAYRLRQSGFATGRGGAEVEHFTDDTTPTRARAEAVSARKAQEVGRSFDVAAADLADLVAIASLRAAIELETSAPNFDRDRVTTWREQLREYVARAGAAGDASDVIEGSTALAPRWGFGPTGGETVYDAVEFAEGAELPIERRGARRRRAW